MKDRISYFYGDTMPLIDSAVLVAERVEKLDCHVANALRNDGGSKHFFMTQSSDAFSHAVEHFFGQKAELLNL